MHIAWSVLGLLFFLYFLVFTARFFHFQSGSVWYRCDVFLLFSEHPAHTHTQNTSRPREQSCTYTAFCLIQDRGNVQVDVVLPACPPFAPGFVFVLNPGWML